MDAKEQDLEERIKKIKATLESVDSDNTKPLVEKERLRLLWEAELTNQEERLYHYRHGDIQVYPSKE